MAKSRVLIDDNELRALKRLLIEVVPLVRNTQHLHLPLQNGIRVEPSDLPFLKTLHQKIEKAERIAVSTIACSAPEYPTELER